MVILMNLRKRKDPRITLGQRVIPSFLDLSAFFRRASFLTEWSPCICSKPLRVVSYLLKQNITRLWLGFWSIKHGEKASPGHGFSYNGEARVSKRSLLLLLLVRPLSNPSLYFLFFSFFLTHFFLFSLFSLDLYSFSLKFLQRKSKNGTLRVKNLFILERVLERISLVFLSLSVGRSFTLTFFQLF